jgi:hypothetical protein
LGNSANNSTATIVGGAADSVWDAGNAIVYAGYANGASAMTNQLVIGAGGSLTNVAQLQVGRWSAGTISSRNQVVVNGGQFAVAGDVLVGYGSGGVFDAGNTRSNTLTIANGSVTRAGGAIYIGRMTYYSGINSSYNSLVVTNGGRLFTRGDSFVGGDMDPGRFWWGTMVGNTATVGGSLNGTNATWDLGASNLRVGARWVGSDVITDNVLAVKAGGVVTNVRALTVTATNALALGPGGQIYAGAATNAGTMTVGIDTAMTPSCGRLEVAGNLNIAGATLDLAAGQTLRGVHVIATYGTRTGTFAATNGLPVWGMVDYAYEGNQVAVIVSPPGALLIVR